MKKIYFIILLCLSLYCLYFPKFTPATEIDNDFDYMELLEEVIIKVKQEYIHDIDNKIIVENAIEGILGHLDQYSGYLNSKNFHEVQEQTKGEFGGTGIEIKKDDNKVKVISVINNTPAQKSGIREGDYIIAVNNQNISNLQLTEITNKLKGNVGSEVKIKLLRDNKEILLNLKRALIKISPITLKVIGEIAYIKISSFTETTAEDLRSNWLRIKKNNLKGILLDLRDNPGGLLNQAIAICDSFLNSGIIVSIRGKNGENEKVYNAHKEGNIFEKLPAIVLINHNSASSSEIVAGALQDHKRALIVGTKSFGKGSVQTVIPIKSGGAIRITNALYYTPLNHSINNRGIYPDVQIESDKKELNNCTSEISKYITRDQANDLNLLDNFDCQLIRAIDILYSIIIYNSNCHEILPVNYSNIFMVMRSYSNIFYDVHSKHRKCFIREQK